MDELRLPIPKTARPFRLAVIDSHDAQAVLEFVHALRLAEPELPLLVLLPALDDPLTYSLLRLGVKGVLAYAQAPRELRRAAHHVADGAYCAPRELLARFIELVLPELHGCRSPQPKVEISRREREVLDLLLENLSNKEIAAKLFVSERTVKFHVSNLLSKFRAQRRADLIIQWMQRSRRDGPWPARDLGKPLTAHIN